MIGIDIVEIDDFKNKDFSKIFTQKECDYINLATSLARKTEVMAGIYAGKEAVFKALKLENIGLEILKSIEILHTPSGAPKCVFKDYDINLSISHTQHTAVAVAIILKK